MEEENIKTREEMVAELGEEAVAKIEAEAVPVASMEEALATAEETPVEEVPVEGTKPGEPTE